MSQPSHDFGGADSSAASTVIRLNTFDECKCRFGNVRKTALETVIDKEDQSRAENNSSPPTPKAEEFRFD